MTTPIRWGLLGTARINRALIPPLRESSRHDLVAVASRDRDRAASYARRWEIPVSYSSYDALLADPTIEAIYNPLPNALHAEWTIRAAQAGKHVLCEKPLAISIAEVDAIAEAARAAGVVVTEAFMYRHHPQTRQLKAMVDTGVLGRLQLIRGAFSFTLTRSADVRLTPALGGGSLWDVGCYPVSMARYLVGREPVRVFGMQRLGPTQIDELFTGELDFGDTIAQFDCSFRAPLRTHLEVVGAEAAITVPVPFKPGLEERLFIARNGAVETVPVPGEVLYAGEVDDFADAVRLGRPPRVTLADSRGNAATLVALLDSAQKGTIVEVPPPDRPERRPSVGRTTE